MVLIFEKKLSNTDINRRLSIPSNAFREHFPPIFHGNTVNIRIRNHGNEEHSLPCYIRAGVNPYEKPVIGGNWHQIASAKGYMEGDNLQFYKERDDNGRTFYRFEVNRKITNETGEQVQLILQ